MATLFDLNGPHFYTGCLKRKPKSIQIILNENTNPNKSSSIKTHLYTSCVLQVYILLAKTLFQPFTRGKKKTSYCIFAVTCLF